MFFVCYSVLHQYKTQEMCETVFSEDSSLIEYCPSKCKTQRMSDSVVFEDPSLIVYCPGQYKTQRMCDKAVDYCLAALTALKRVPNWLDTSKTIKKLLAALYANKDILYFNEGSGDVVFNCNEIL